MSKYTKGPWSNKYFDLVVGNNNRTQICYLNHGAGKTKGTCAANARLIAAAPELLEACKQLLNSTDLNVEDQSHLDQTTLEAVELIKKAIAKAEGKE